MKNTRKNYMPLELRKLNLAWVKAYLECRQDAKRPTRDVWVLKRPPAPKLNLKILPGMFDFDGGEGD